ncbi:uncharacterized protein PRCAT00006263001 [Priceomyces carsonii]|uniref:uncharacterized protein n=1 Tax=Priceomyces carsonii TaxID=28549 RepID=UPI002EDAF6E7|nr:unnamed protein product [Priceomyces carsonii]
MKLEQEKLDLLCLYFPKFDRDVLAELLNSCDGSVQRTKALVDGSEAVSQTKKRNSALYQSSIAEPLAISTAKRHRPLTSSAKVIRLHTPKQVQAHLYPFVSLHRAILPRELSDEILRYLMGLKESITPNKFYIFDNYCTSSHGSGLMAPGEDDKQGDTVRNLIYNGKPPKIVGVYSDEMKQAAGRVADIINEKLIPLLPSLPFQNKERWGSNMCIVNYYENISSHLDYHSDRLSHIGPHNYIASISLGATREFRLRKNYGSKQIYSIVLPHNCLVIMHPGCQEEFKHCVNALKSSIEQNPISGKERYNLTFRFYPKSFVRHLPRCKCDLSMTLRRSYLTVENRGKYFWSCENKYQHKDCGTFHWANFNNLEGNYIAECDEDISIWTAEDDVEKNEWIAKQSEDYPSI